MEKNHKKAKLGYLIVSSIVVLSFSYLATLAVMFSSPKYEYYDVYGNYGTSNDCGEIQTGSLACLVNENFITVKQYSKIEKGFDKNDIWKK